VTVGTLVATIAIAIVAMMVGLLVVLIIGNKVYKKLDEKLTSIDKKSDMRGGAVMSGPMDSGMNDNYMISFQGDQWGGNVPQVVGVGFSSEGSNDGGKPPKEMPKQEIQVKPIDVVKELQRSPTNWSLNGLDDKINIVKAKKDLVSQSTAGRDLSALLLCLENRKKCYDDYEYEPDKTMTFKAFFEQWDTTNEANIHTLTEKYSNLQFNPADIFVPELPDIAAKTMIDYDHAVRKLCDKRPRFYVIADKKDFNKKYQARDPILLVQSPFGVYYHILGAWDTEMQYLPEL